MPVQQGFTIKHDNPITLVDSNNTVVHTWDNLDGSTIPLGTSYNLNIYPNLDILKDTTPSLQLYDSTGNEIWEIGLLFEWWPTYFPEMDEVDHRLVRHHDSWVMEDSAGGHLILIGGSHQIPIVEAINSYGRYSFGEMTPYGMYDDTSTTMDLGFIQIIKPTGIGTGNYDAELVFEWYMIDHLVQDTNPTLPNYGDVNDPTKININLPSNTNLMTSVNLFDASDFMHHNTIHYDPIQNNVIISSRNIGEGEFYVVSIDTGEIVYRCCNPQNYGRGDEGDRYTNGSHGANVIPHTYPDGGDIIWFSNEGPVGQTEISEVVKITPNYEAFPDGDFDFTQNLQVIDIFNRDPSGGGAFGLPNGNIFVSPGTHTDGYEVTDPWTNPEIIQTILGESQEMRMVKYVCDSEQPDGYMYRVDICGNGGDTLPNCDKITHQQCQPGEIWGLYESICQCYSPLSPTTQPNQMGDVKPRPIRQLNRLGGRNNQQPNTRGGPGPQGGWKPVYGCSDSDATNYNPLANTPDGSCIYEDPYCFHYMTDGSGDCGVNGAIQTTMQSFFMLCLNKNDCYKGCGGTQVDENGNYTNWCEGDESQQLQGEEWGVFWGNEWTEDDSNFPWLNNEYWDNEQDIFLYNPLTGLMDIPFWEPGDQMFVMDCGSPVNGAITECAQLDMFSTDELWRLGGVVVMGPGGTYDDLHNVIDAVGPEGEGTAWYNETGGYNPGFGFFVTLMLEDGQWNPEFGGTEVNGQYMGMRLGTHHTIMHWKRSRGLFYRSDNLNFQMPSVLLDLPNSAGDIDQSHIVPYEDWTTTSGTPAGGAYLTAYGVKTLPGDAQYSGTIAHIGCMNPEAMNYSPENQYEPVGACMYQDEYCSEQPNMCGCTDLSAMNYNSTAIVDDNSCRYDTTPPPADCLQCSSDRDCFNQFGYTETGAMFCNMTYTTPGQIGCCEGRSPVRPDPPMSIRGRR